MDFLANFNLIDILSNFLSDSISTILTAITQFIYGVMGFFLSPLDNMIQTYFPDISNVIEMVNTFFNYITQFIVWVLTWLHVPTLLFNFALAYFGAKLTVSFLAHTIKLVLAWWRTLAP